MEEEIKQEAIAVPESFVGKRLDYFLTHEAHLDLTRTAIQGLIKNGNVLVNSEPSKASYKLKEGDSISISLPPPEECSIKPEPIDLDIVFEDDELMVINKAVDMVTHPAPGVYSGTLVNAVLHHCKHSDGTTSLSGINGVLRPGIVHRLDKDTSGLMVVAKTDKAHQDLANQIQKRTLERRYLALVYDNIKESKGEINRSIGRHPKHRHKMAVIDSGNSKYAKTNYFVKERYSIGTGSEAKAYTLVECKLDTGRTHQIRVHMAHLRHPIVGDETYGPSSGKQKKNPFKVSRPLLHSYKIAFEHPSSKQAMEFEIAIPRDMQDVLDSLNN